MGSISGGVATARAGSPIFGKAAPPPSLKASSVPVARAAVCTPARSVSTIIDDSDSMVQSDPRGIRRRALELLIRKPSTQARVLGAVEFGETAAPLFLPSYPRNGQATMLSALGALSDDGAPDGGSSTNYNAAFRASSDFQPGADARVFLTDGAHNEGDFENLHRGGPRTYVIGLGIGPAGKGDGDADVLGRIASETGGRYFSLKRRPRDSSALQLRRLQPAMNQIDALLACQAPPRTFTKRFVRPRQTAGPMRLSFRGYGAMEIVATRTLQGIRCRLVRAYVRNRRGRVIADLRGKRRIPGTRKRRKRLSVRAIRGATYDSWAVIRPKGGATIEIWIRVGRLPKPVRVTVQLRPIPVPAPAPQGVAPPPAKNPNGPKLPPVPPKHTLTVDNRVTNGGGMREDPTPVRLTTQPWVYCGSRGCNINGTERHSGETYERAVCQTSGERTTNGNDGSSADDANPERFESTRYYGVRLANGTFGYVSEVWIAAPHRGGRGLPQC